MKYADLPRQRLNHLVKPDGMTLEEWQVMLRMQQAQREDFDVECVSERYRPGEYRVRSPKSGGVYKVIYRGPKSPWNYCDCMDFKTSQLGTCKHIEGARQWIADHHKRIHRDLPAYTSVYLSHRSNQRQVRIRIGQTREADFKALAAHYFDELGTLMPHAYAHFGEFLTAAKAIDEGFRCYPDAREFVIEQREAINRRKVVDERYTDEAMDTLLTTKLYPFQKEGVRFAACAGRAILADEMGLGKTVQAIATAELLRREGFVGSVLILCPTTLKYQWKREIERFTTATVTVIDGTAEQRRQQMEADGTFYKIASYNSIVNSPHGSSGHATQGELSTFNFPDLLILDEVQRLKNWNTQIAKAVRKITSRYTLILSGTPLENRLEELYSIVELVDQFLLAPYYQFRDRYIVMDDTGRTVGYRNLSDISKRLGGIMLRRRKADVALQLPPRIDKNLFVPMTTEQMDAHQDLKLQAARLVSKWHRQHFLSEMDRRQLLMTLSQMRMVCDSLFVLDEHSRFDTKVEEVMNILNECGVTINGEGAQCIVHSDSECIVHSDSECIVHGDSECIVHSAEVHSDTFAGGNPESQQSLCTMHSSTMHSSAMHSSTMHSSTMHLKVVIFSQWERMTRLVAQELERSGVEYTYLHGSIPAAERQQRVETFQTDPSVRVFLSTDAGATGLNLQAANVIINLDLPWNPAVLEQRIGRIHRMGQQRGVEVINLIAAGTIEEDMLSKLRFKTSLFEGVLDGGEDAVFLASDKFDGLLTSLDDYIQEEGNATVTAPTVSIEDEEQPRHAEPRQTLLDFDEVAGPSAVEAIDAIDAIETIDSPVLSQTLKSLASLLLADEPTRRKAVEILNTIIK